MINSNCDGCTFAMAVIGDDDQPTMECRRFPPAVFLNDGDSIQMFPNATVRCGEFVQERFSKFVTPEDDREFLVKIHSRLGLEALNSFLNSNVPGNTYVDEAFDGNVFSVITTRPDFLTVALTQHNVGEVLDD